ncbi:MAG TPA: CoA-binding protein [Puia sp.]|jgi:hypothetical protein|nr:CoA-binding protein [Puia sp.]
MANDGIEHYKKILKEARGILLIDWPSQAVPRGLLNAGLTVFCFSPNQYSKAGLESAGNQNVEGNRVLLPAAGAESMNLVFTKIESITEPIDIVHIYRPEAEHAKIIIDHVLPLHAKVLWLQPPITSLKTRDLAKQYGITYIEEVDITDTAGAIIKK